MNDADCWERLRIWVGKADHLELRGGVLREALIKIQGLRQEGRWLSDAISIATKALWDEPRPRMFDVYENLEEHMTRVGELGGEGSLEAVVAKVRAEALRTWTWLTDHTLVIIEREYGWDRTDRGSPRAGEGE